MLRLRQVSLTLGLTFLIAACSSNTDPEPQTATGGTSNAQAGSSSGNSSTSGGSNSGGSSAAGSGNNTSGSGVGGSSSSGGDGAGGSGVTAGTSSGGSSSGGETNNQAGTGSAGAPPVVVNLPEVVTSSNNAFWKVGTLTPVTSGNADVTANANNKKQRWDGFGGTFNEAGWDALSVLSEADRLLAIKYLFDAQDGANFVYGRLPIGASDYALARYTLAETKDDFTMSSFSIAQDKKYLIPFVKAALAVKPDIRLWASPWTPPAWMKSNNSVDSGNMKDDDNVLKAFALYLQKFVEAYAAEGLKIEAIHPQNEPGYVTPYPSCGWSQALFIKFIRDYLGPQFEKEKVPAEIWCGTMSSPSDGSIAQALAQDAKAMSYVKGFGLQWNTMDSINALKSKNVPIMQTEHRCGNYDFQSPHATSSYDPNKPQNDFAYGVESWGNIKDWIDAGVNSYSAWNMVLDTLGRNLNAQKPWHQNALLVVDRNAKKLIATPAYYVFRHLSQFVAPKANVIGVNGGNSLAFQNPDGTYVVVIYNSGAAKKAIVALGDSKYQFDMAGNGWTTIYRK